MDIIKTLCRHFVDSACLGGWELKLMSISTVTLPKRHYLYNLPGVHWTIIVHYIHNGD